MLINLVIYFKNRNLENIFKYFIGNFSSIYLNRNNEVSHKWQLLMFRRLLS